MDGGIVDDTTVGNNIEMMKIFVLTQFIPIIRQ
jgi:hypothetical protein